MGVHVRSSLQYPMKPTELSDDLEGFVHVLIDHVLRFHYHDMTIIPPGNHAPEELVRINRTAEELANFVSQYFFSKSLLPDGSIVGGRAKMFKIQTGDPGFRILATKDPLARLISDLFALLKEHYAAIDMASLASYRPTTQYDDPTPYEKDPIIARKPKPMDSPSGAPSPNAAVSSVSGPTLASKASLPASVVNPPRHTLDDHKGIIEMFERAFAAGRRLATSLAKTPDQFLGWGDVRTITSRNSSDNSSNYSDGSTELDSENDERPLKRARTESRAPSDIAIAEQGS